MARSRRHIPKHSHHEASNRGVVCLDGHDHYTGIWGTEEADLPQSVEDLYIHLKEPGTLDVAGWFTSVGGEVRFKQGKKYRGQPLAYVARTDPGYLEWMLREDFFEDTKALVRRALEDVAAPIT